MWITYCLTENKLGLERTLWFTVKCLEISVKWVKWHHNLLWMGNDWKWDGNHGALMWKYWLNGNYRALVWNYLLIYCEMTCGFTGCEWDSEGQVQQQQVFPQTTQQNVISALQLHLPRPEGNFRAAIQRK